MSNTFPLVVATLFLGMGIGVGIGVSFTIIAGVLSALASGVMGWFKPA